LKVNEIFYSIQGEGLNVGCPALFIRLTGCNLRCSWCDTQYAYDEGVEMVPEQIALNAQYYTHIVITGGEPLLQESELTELVELLSYSGAFIEVETNGTIIPSANLTSLVDLFNVSPKFPTISGADFNLSVLRFFTQLDNAIFKFVIENDDDFNIMQQLQNELQLSNDQILLMPEGTTENTVKTNSLKLVELCKKANYRFSPRLHIMLYNRSKGV
jgi:organic radical activating enzyme